MPKQFPIFIICAVWAFQAVTQNVQNLKQQGKSHFEQANYLSAIEIFESAKKLNPNDSEIQYFLGVSHYYNESPKLAKQELLPLSNLKKSPNEKLFFYLGKVCHAQHEFKDAVQFYKEFLRRYEKNNALRNEVKADILRCAVGMKSMINRDKVQVENLGEIVNSEFDDFAPIVSPNDVNKLYFSSNRKVPEFDSVSNLNIFFTQIKNGKRTQPELLTKSINSNADEVLWSFDKEGEKMYFFQGDFPYPGDYFFREKSKGVNHILFQYEQAVSAHYGNIEQPHFGQSTLVFSMRTGKFSHVDLDLFLAQVENGFFFRPKIFDEPINSYYNEISPFLSEDGKTLYFSSDNPRMSMGGYDIFKSEFDEKTQTWSEPENLKYPINSAGDDMHFRISTDGYSAYFSSDRMTGFGGNDIYSVHFPSSKNEIKEITKSHKPKTGIQPVKGLSYKIKITETDAAKADQLRKKFTYLTNEKMSNSDSFYLILGQYRTFQSANLLRKDLIRQGYANIEINAFIDGKEIGKTEAENLVLEYPDLRLFLKNR